MSTDWQAGITTLLNQSRACFLSTQGELGPETSMAPFAVHHGTVLLHLSTLAQHSTNIKASPSIGLMVCTPETMESSPLALPRLSLQGEALPVADAQLEKAIAAYLQVIPDAEPLFSFADFQLFEVRPSHIRWVGGFGTARNISLEKWHSISRPDA